MPRFSANLGFLWSDLSLPDAIRAAKAAGFDAVECHWPYDVAPSLVREALSQTGLPMLGLNTIRGREGEFGLAALPGREIEARSAIEQAIGYAGKISALNVHVMAGVAGGQAAAVTFRENLDFACELAAPLGISILIEAMNETDVPGYFLQTPAAAISIIDDLRHDNLKLMFDCYHTGKSGLDVIGELDRAVRHIGHIQFAAVPDRGTPDHGTVDYGKIFNHLDAAGYDKPLGAEYRPGGRTEESLAWLAKAKSV